jgi:hypothetical protein
MNPMQTAFTLGKQICDAMDYFLSAVDEDRITWKNNESWGWRSLVPFFELSRK